MKKRVIIMGAAGRDFHNFNVYFKNNRDYEVVCFTASQIDGISNRVYPPTLSGKLYPKGIPIIPEEELAQTIRREGVDEVVLAYSDLSHEEVMHKASLILSSGADFRLLGFKHTMLKASKPVISVCAVRTGCGKSMTTRSIMRTLKDLGKKVVVIRHPMPYGNLSEQVYERFESLSDLDKFDCTIEEREEFEHLIREGGTVYAGVDYEKILAGAEHEADVIIWDGGNNDFPFIVPNLHIVLVDPLRPGHELKYYPGETNLRVADIVLIPKISQARKEDIKELIENIKSVNKKASIIRAESKLHVDNVRSLKNKRVLIIEDGPTMTHGGMSFGAGFVASKKYGAKIIDPRPYAVGSIKKTFKKYPHLKKVLPAMGYSEKQMKELERTINNAKCDAVVVGTPVDITRLMNINKPVIKVRYELKERSKTKLKDHIMKLLSKDL